MKRKILIIATGFFLTAGTILSISTDRNGDLHFLNNASAVNNYKEIKDPCPGNLTYIIACGAGGTGCTPSGSCQ